MSLRRPASSVNELGRIASHSRPGLKPCCEREVGTRSLMASGVLSTQHAVHVR